MSVVDKFTKPSVAKLAERIQAIEGDVAALESKHDQAEAEAVGLSGDETKYHRVAANAAKIKADLDDQRERLGQL